MNDQASNGFAWVLRVIGLVVLVAVWVKWDRVEPYVSAVLGLDSPDVEVMTEEVNVNNERFPFYVPRLTVINKGRDVIELRQVKINGRPEPACTIKPAKKLLTGDEAPMLIDPTCGKPVRVTVETDKGSSEFKLTSERSGS